MAKRDSLIGQRFGRLKVYGIGERGENGKYKILCDCDCGNKVITVMYDLTSGNTKSCGCLQKYIASKRSATHRGCRNHPREYAAWCAMKSRCYNVNAVSYDRYGARGILVCDRWINDFPTFFKDMGERPSKGHSLERKNNELGYFPENCEWATRDIQANNKRSSIRVTYKGITKTQKQWADFFGINYKTFKNRLRAGIPFERAKIRPQVRKGIHRLPESELRELVNSGFSLSKMGRHFGVDPSVIKHRIEFFNIKY